LGDIAPGAFPSVALQFSDPAHISSAGFMATVDTTSLLLRPGQSTRSHHCLGKSWIYTGPKSGTAHEGAIVYVS
jgi:hypothetical protein